MQLPKEKKYDFRTKLTEQKRLICDTGIRLLENELSLAGGVRFIGSFGTALEYAKTDFINFLNSEENKEEVSIEFFKCDEKLGEYAAYKGYTVSVERDKILINAFDDRGAAAALYDIEKMLLAKRAPYIKLGKFSNKPLFSPRMIHSAYGLEEYPRGYMQNLVKEGIDAIVVFTKDINTTQVGTLDFNSLIKEANEIGLDVYAYCMLNNFHHHEEEGAEQIFDGIYGRFFRAHPGFKGIVLVGESVEFPSRDPRVTPRHYYEIGNEDNIPDGKKSPGWWPCNDYPGWVSLLAKTVRQVKPDADIVFWTYNWGYAPKEDRIALIEALPDNITLQVTFEMFEKRHFFDVDNMVMDYSIAFPGPGEYYLSEAEAARKKGIKLYTMCNAGGRTWDFGMLPFIPATELWAKRYSALRDSYYKHGLAGTMECHHYGFTPSFITRFADYCFSSEGSDIDACLDMALYDFFGENRGGVKEALAVFSDAMEKYYPPTDEMQYGPMRISTAYPLNLVKKLQPIEKQNVSFGLRICNLVFDPWDFGRYSPQSLRLNTEIKAIKAFRDESKRALSMLLELNSENEELLKLINMMGFIVSSLETAANAYEFYKWKMRLFSAESAEKLKAAVRNIKRIGKREIKNAEKSLKFVDRDSSLGFEPSMCYAADRERIEWKIKQVKYMLDVELKIYDLQA